MLPAWFTQSIQQNLASLVQNAQTAFGLIKEEVEINAREDVKSLAQDRKLDAQAFARMTFYEKALFKEWRDQFRDYPKLPPLYRKEGAAAFLDQRAKSTAAKSTAAAGGLLGLHSRMWLTQAAEPGESSHEADL